MESRLIVDPQLRPLRGVLPLLLSDKTTKKNIIFATESYLELGEMFGAKLEITPSLLVRGGSCIIQPRVLKDREQQQLRTKKRAEVFTPSWVCCMMIDHLDEEWFGEKHVFGRLEDRAWTPSSESIAFTGGRRWQDYVDSRRLEITCGEAPYLVSRYDMATGELIPIEERIGILDRKLRVVNENAETDEEWLKWAQRAFQSVYGYEYQGDNLFIARVNLILSFDDYFYRRMHRSADEAELRPIANIISRNLFQMDGLKGTIPLGALYETHRQLSLFDAFDEEEEEPAPPCTIYDWRAKKSIEFNSLKKGGNGMKFDFIIGNPPYQEEQEGENKTFAPPIYNKFMDASFKVAEKVELIHPARFLFNAGSTPKAWNEMMLQDEHFKILYYEEDGQKVFPSLSTPLRGGVAISYRDANTVFGAIGIFTKFNELNSILRKVKQKNNTGWFDSIVFIQNRFNLTALYADYPDLRSFIGSDGRDSRFEKNIFVKIPLFTEEETPQSIRTLGVFENKRTWRFINKKYVDLHHENLDKYKVVVSVANGSGEFGQALSTPVIQKPNEAYTRSYIGIGAFDTNQEANNCNMYLKTKFCRAMLHILKVTQMANKDVWLYVPIQNFTSASDIDWSQSVAGIDGQLYRKYGLSDEEIAFIESHVKEMS